MTEKPDHPATLDHMSLGHSLGLWEDITQEELDDWHTNAHEARALSGLAPAGPEHAALGQAPRDAVQ